MLGCYRYIELNQVRAGIVEHPAEYRWSSYRSNAQGEHTILLKPNPIYSALGHDRAKRIRAYRELFRHELEPGKVDEIRQATNGNYVLGSPQFKSQIESVLGRRAIPGKSGRPRKGSARPEQDELF